MIRSLGERVESSLSAVVESTAAPWVVLLAAAALRLELFLHDRSFWLDESLLGLNLIEKSAHGLLGTLDYGQSAPPAFLLTQKAAITVFGQTEQAFRLLPLISSLVGLWFFRLVAKRLLPPAPALLALTLFAANSVLVYQSSEAKPYSSDVAVALVLVWLALRALDAISAGRIVAVVLPSALVGAVAVWLSYPAVFVLGASFAAALVRCVSERRWRCAWWLVAAGGCVLGSFIAVYLVSSRSISSVQRSVFVGDQPVQSRLHGLVSQMWEVISDPGGFPDKLRGLGLLVLAAGLFVLFTKYSVDRIVLLAGPGALALLASVVNAYPFGGRYSLFLVPYMAVLLAFGAAELVSASRRPLLVAGLLLPLLGGVLVVQAVDTAINPPARENVRPLLVRLSRDWRPGDTLFVYRNAQYALRFYAECSECGVAKLPFPILPAAANVDNGGTAAALASAPPSVVVGTTTATPAASLRQLDVLRGKRRIWLLFAHVAGAGSSLDEERLSLAYIGTFGRRLGSWNEPSAALFLYDTRSS